MEKNVRTFQSHKVPADLTTFRVITCISNSAMFKRRYELYHPFAEMIENAGAQLITVEAAFGDRPFMVTQSNNPNHLQVRGVDELWLKERMNNLAINHAQRLSPGKVTKVAMVDADCRPSMPCRDWLEATVHALDHFEFAQMWSTIVDLDITGNPIGTPGPSFMANYLKYGNPYPPGVEGGPYTNATAPSWGSPGLAWAANISALDQIGMIPDYAILGAGDWYLAHMLISGLELSSMQKYSPGYRNKFLQQQQLCERWIKRDVGCIDAFMLHDFHGRKLNRQYSSRENILLSNQFDPNTDLKLNSFGLWQFETWEPRQIKMRDQTRAYVKQRNEDSIDL